MNFDLNEVAEDPFEAPVNGSDNYASGSTHHGAEVQQEHSERRREAIHEEPTIPDISNVDYDEDSDASTDSDFSADSDASFETMNESIIKFTFADFQSWVHTEGGLTKLMSMLNPDNDRVVNSEIGRNETNNWLLPIIPLDMTESLVWCDLDPTTEDGEIGVGSYYSTKNDLEVANCRFELRGIHRGNVWAVHRFKADHTCLRELGYLGKVKAKADVVAAFSARKMRTESRIVKPSEIINELHESYDIDITYDVALRGRNNWVELIFGRHTSSFQMLPGYLHKLVEVNPGTLTDLDVGEDGKFQHLFVALGSSRMVYNYCLRPLIIVDGAHLKGRNKGILFVAVTIDANEQVYPLAYSVGPLENDASWKWFLERVYAAYGCTQNTVIISDAHISIGNGVRHVYLNAHHALCFFHILNKLKSYGKPVTDM
ncbi:hypothetical protein OROGR_016479 [Orobanche gracilis]